MQSAHHGARWAWERSRQPVLHHYQGHNWAILLVGWRGAAIPIVNCRSNCAEEVRFSPSVRPKDRPGITQLATMLFRPGHMARDHRVEPPKRSGARWLPRLGLVRHPAPGGQLGG